ncbi:MAG TPA: aldo/keto reductase [Burkholderiales bacterium]|nr:aldo/keto reductase [Burkholderiales bacterium]
MEYCTLGRTGLKVSVAGLGCGGSSRLGLTAGHSEAHAVDVIRQAVDLGVNLIDTASSYGTEPVVGAALKSMPRSSVVVSTKHKVAEGKVMLSAAAIVAGLDASLKTLETDYVDIFFLHTVFPAAYAHVAREVIPVLLREKEKGKFRFLGITEMAPRDPCHDMLQNAFADDCVDVIMFAFHMLNQNARNRVFPAALSQNIGTLIMFAVRSLFSTPGRLQQDLQALVADGKVPAALAEKSQPLDFLLHDGGARDVVEAAYRYVRHQPGANVVLFGTGKAAHVASNIDSILKPPLPPADTKKLHELFGHLEGVGLDLPNHKRQPNNGHM